MFYSVRFDDRVWENLFVEGWRIFIQYELDGESSWTQTRVFHLTAEEADMEVYQILLDGIKDAKDGVVRIPRITRVVRQRWPIPN
jgi:hypothetical protein